MVDLILNENMKIYRRWRSWVMVGLLLVVVMTGSIMDWYYDRQAAPNYNWQEQVTLELEQYQKSLNDTEMSGEAQEYIEQRMAISEYYLAENIQPHQYTMWNAINGMAGLVIMITLLTIIVAGESLAGEFSSGTIKMLLIRPVNRSKIFLAKYITVILFALLLLLILFVSSVLVNGVLYQFEHLDLPLVTVNDDGQVVERNMIANLWNTYFLNGVATIIFVTMAFMISAAFRSSAMAIGISLFSLFAGSMFSNIVRIYDWGKYVLFSNIDLTQHLAGNKPYQEGMTLGFSITVLLVYYLVFMFVAWSVFTKRDVAA